MPSKDFSDGLVNLGYQPRELGENRLAFPYTIDVGKFAGRTIELGFVVSEDFPLAPPSGPHVSPQLLEIHTQADLPHPAGGVHPSDFGAEWQYWSRPFPEWQATDRSVQTYMAHIRKLFVTQ